MRAREDCRSDLMRTRHRSSKLLLRHGIVYCCGQARVGTHDARLRRQRFDSSLVQAAFDEAYDSVVTITACRDHLDEPITAMTLNSQYTDVVRRLGCLRGISTLVGFYSAVEIGDWNRFTGNSIGSFVGPVPSENTSGQSRSLGPIAKTGNGHARGLLGEAAWHHQHRYVPGKTIRVAGASPAPPPTLVETWAIAGSTIAGTSSRSARRPIVAASVTGTGQVGFRVWIQGGCPSCRI